MASSLYSQTLLIGLVAKTAFYVFSLQNPKNATFCVSVELLHTFARTPTTVVRGVVFVADGRELFGEFLRNEFSDENLEFWLECERFRACEDDQQLAVVARQIYQDFVAPNAPRQVYHRSLKAKVPGFNDSIIVTKTVGVEASGCEVVNNLPRVVTQLRPDRESNP